MKQKLPPLDPAWLRQKYLVEGLSTYDIAKMVGHDSTWVHRQLRASGIPTRPRGQNLRGQDNYMSQPGVKNPFEGHRHTEETRAILSQKASVPKPYLRGARNGMSTMTGSKNPNYKTGSSPERQRLYASGEWKALVKAVYARDHYRCVRCGTVQKSRRSFHAHHLKSWTEYPALRFDMENLVTLCHACHSWVHSRKNVANDYLR